MLANVENCARLVLLRHPELEASAQHQALGHRPAALSRRGHASQLEVLRRLADLGIDQVFTCDLPQAAELAIAIAKDRGLEAIHEPRLRDQEMGQWEGESWQELGQRDKVLVAEFFSNFSQVAPPGGESLTEALARVMDWWRELAPECRDQTVLVVANTPLLSGFAAALVGLPLRRSLALGLPPAGFGVLDVFGDGAVVRTWHPGALETDPQ
jgi:probable phosphoglycerate mutase